MTPPQAALFKFSQRSLHGTRMKLAGTGSVDKTVGSLHDTLYWLIVSQKKSV